ncbi:MAG: hypothetical protein ACFE8L_13670 [Candidatus Hodarchaeota archaeon]
MATVWYPYNQRIKMAKTAIEAAKKFPPDETVQKNLATGYMRDKAGIKVVIMNEVMEGKLQEALDRVNETIDLYIDIEGFSVRIDLMATPLEAWQSINMKMPE